MGAITYQREPARRGAYRLETWWARAFLRAVEEAAYDDAQLAGARSLARSGRIGGIVVDRGTFAAAVDAEDGLWTVTGTVPVVDAESVSALVEVLPGDPARVDAVLAGQLPHDLVEHAEEAGVELVPYGGELAATCTCRHWHDVCSHALAVLHQAAWLVDRDAQVLLHLRGVPREDLLARLRQVPPSAAGLRAGGDGAVGGLDTEPVGEPDSVEIAIDAALRARRLLAE